MCAGSSLALVCQNGFVEAILPPPLPCRRPRLANAYTTPGRKSIDEPRPPSQFTSSSSSSSLLWLRPARVGQCLHHARAQKQ